MRMTLGNLGCSERPLGLYSAVVPATSPEIPIAVNLRNFACDQPSPSSGFATVATVASSRSDSVRAVVVSHLYADPANRAKLRALAGLGVTLAAAVPDRWVTSEGVTQKTAAGDDGGVQVVPIPVRGPATEPGPAAVEREGRLRQLITDFQPEPDPHRGGALEPAGGARASDWPGGWAFPSVLSTAESLPRSYTLGQRFRRERSLRLAAGVIGSNNLALALATKRRPTVPHLSLPHLGVTPPALPPRVPHPGLAIGFVGRLVPERGLDLLFRACVGLAGKWTLTVVGTGPSQEELEGLAQRLGIAARISWARRLAAGRRWTRSGPGSTAWSSPPAPPSAG